LPRLPDNMRPADPANPYADYSADHLYSFLMEWSPATPPGNKSEYSNLGSGLLGHLLALQAGTTYEALLKERILGPLRMGDTAICLTSEMHERLARPHHADGSPAATWDIPILAGAGAVRSSVRDMLKFLKAQLHGPAGTLGQGIETAWKVHWKPRSTHDVALGLGWHIARDGHTRWHNGRTGGYGAMALVSRKKQIAVVVLANTATDEVDRLAEELFQVAAGKEPPLRLFPKTPALEVPIEILHRYAGRYALSPEFHLTVRVEGDQLLVQATGQPAFRVFPASETEWFYKVVDARLTFQMDGEGGCEALTLHQNGLDMPGRRVRVPVETPGFQP
jgi:serine-type D-Ala-D-Ala carboxypeptidase/endopeptidase